MIGGDLTPEPNRLAEQIKTAVLMRQSYSTNIEIHCIVLVTVVQ